MKQRFQKNHTHPYIFILSIPVTIVAIALMRFHPSAINSVNIQDPSILVIKWFAYSLLSFALTKLSSNYRPTIRNYHRIIFISIIVFGTAILVISTQPILAQQSLIYLVLVWTGGFSGSFFASMHSAGFWENNEPPAASVEQLVIEAHKGFNHASGKSQFTKRCMDIVFALVSILISSPVWLLIIILIWWEDPGPVLFVKNPVGRGGSNYKQLKFRSMVTDAEKETGPISGYENDERVLFFGKLLRKTALDELPQLINILIGDMSYVGPRPQRTVLVHQYLKTMPEYAARHQVRPGLAGLAQVVDSYSISPEEKLAWDLIYIDRANIWFDLKLIFAAFLLVFGLRWRTKSDPEFTIRRLLKIDKPEPNPSMFE